MRRKRIISPFSHLTTFKDGEKIYIGINIKETDLDIIRGMGFTIPIKEGECLLPSPKYGKPFFDNAEGKITIHKDRKKETAYAYREWDFQDWHGNWHSASAFIPYKRYPRTQEPPLNIELTIFNGPLGKNVLAISSPISKTQENAFRIKTAMNMFLILFNRFDVFDESLKKPVTIIKTVPWEILKPGTKLENHSQIKELFDKVTKSQKSMYKGDLDFLIKYNPSMIATGKMGFHGYIVFFYPEKNIAILESVIPGNATYVFDKDWEEFSRLTKTEVLSEKLQKDRIIHYDNWKDKVKKILI